MPTQPTYTWTHVKAQLKDLQKDDFLLLLHDLYALNADNRLFLTTRLLAGTPAEMVAPYRKAISQVFNPMAAARSSPVLRGAPRRNILTSRCAGAILIYVI